ncbi:hypothetical protein DPMN_097558 [Dreissena polymorpha]|uniref:Uncharacterized protein n=1 Tax=Dreissena polymorpha TaxID=45954 RepID=A0A9D4R5I2_DREPO|nr:hypothetical protein DPMN_097558 [Dreissena polymorpha]
MVECFEKNHGYSTLSFEHFDCCSKLLLQDGLSKKDPDDSMYVNIPSVDLTPIFIVLHGKKEWQTVEYWNIKFDENWWKTVKKKRTVKNLHHRWHLVAFSGKRWSIETKCHRLPPSGKRCKILHCFPQTMANGGVLKQNAIVCHPVENEVKFYIVFHRPWQTVEY